LGIKKFWVLGLGFWFGYKNFCVFGLGFGFRYKKMLGFGFWVLGLGFWFGYNNFWVFGLGFWFGYKNFWVLGLGIKIFGFWVWVQYPTQYPNLKLIFWVQTSEFIYRYIPHKNLEVQVLNFIHEIPSYYMFQLIMAFLLGSVKFYFNF